MLAVLKKILPKSLKQFLVVVNLYTYDFWQKKRLFMTIREKHSALIEKVKNKNKIKVVFLAIHESVWKVDPIFKKMLADPFFEPVILVCPYSQYGSARMQQDMNAAYDYFHKKKYPVIKAQKKDGSWVELKELEPDIVFFTNPHDLTLYEYYEYAYQNYLSCYVPYYFMATNHAGNDLAVLNTSFFMSMWKIYWASDYTKTLDDKKSASKGFSTQCFGYPAVENLLSNPSLQESKVWKKQEKKRKRIIYAPHHSIEKNSKSLSSFMTFGESMKSIAVNKKDEIQWSFKPHPILKSKLYQHPDWGPKKTDEYYNFWKDQAYTQLDEGEYDELFMSSDAIIHDCSSFIVEYAFTGNPCLYLINNNNLKGLLNDFGKGVMNVYKQARSTEEIKLFVDSVIHESVSHDKQKRAYFDAYLEKHYKKKLPSDNIIDDIKYSLGAQSDS